MWFVIFAFHFQTAGILFMCIAFFLSPVSNKYTIVALIYFICVATYSVYETSSPPAPDFDPRNQEMLRMFVPYDQRARFSFRQLTLGNQGKQLG